MRVASTPWVLYLSGYHTLFDTFQVPPCILTYNIRSPREDTVQLVLLLREHTSIYRVYPGWGSHQVIHCLADPEAVADMGTGRSQTRTMPEMASKKQRLHTYTTTQDLDDFQTTSSCKHCWAVAGVTAPRNLVAHSYPKHVVTSIHKWTSVEDKPYLYHLICRNWPCLCWVASNSKTNDSLLPYRIITRMILNSWPPWHWMWEKDRKYNQSRRLENSEYFALNELKANRKWMTYARIELEETVRESQVRRKIHIRPNRKRLDLSCPPRLITVNPWFQDWY
jgi:hypothetical protein